MQKEIKIAFEDPDSGLFEIHRPGSEVRRQHLTEKEFQRLQVLMNDTKWIVVRWTKLPQRQEIQHSPGALDEHKLSDELLHKLVDGVPLSDSDKQNIIDSANQNLY